MEKEKGQTLLIVVLVMVIALTVILSLAARSVVNLRNSNEEASSQKALSAAEAGVEEALQNAICVSSCPTVSGSINSNTFSTNIESLPYPSKEFLFNNGDVVAKDDGADLWLIDHNKDGSLNYASGWQSVGGSPSLTFYWGTPSSDACSSAALELIVLSENNASSDNGASVKSDRYIYDPCSSSSRRPGNKFSSPLSGGTVAGQSFSYSATINIPNNSGILVRALPYYANSPIGVAAGCSTGQNCSLPSQGNAITSTGTSGKTTRKITIFRGYSELPTEFFPFILFSP
ncbi:pilus assembly PilX N-terminal domain-containing protein [Patescibacteria group bacterium]|nr:pilus assembly PilX N-terminal domain-containing protein [Patescibacteria group bacterium]MCL5010330.1 pilus assembly PilX N-terminal domain-containing protein [Patescibacteria group bacterium]